MIIWQSMQGRKDGVQALSLCTLHQVTLQFSPAGWLASFRALETLIHWSCEEVIFDVYVRAPSTSCSLGSTCICRYAKYIAEPCSHVCARPRCEHASSHGRWIEVIISYGYLDTFNALHHNRGGRPPSVADSRDSVVAHLELMEEGGQDARSRATEGMAKGYSAAE